MPSNEFHMPLSYTCYYILFSCVPPSPDSPSLLVSPLFLLSCYIFYCLLYFPLPLRSLPSPSVPFLIFDLQIHMYKHKHYIHNFKCRSHIYMKAHMEHFPFCLAFINIMISAISIFQLMSWLHFLQLHKIILFYM